MSRVNKVETGWTIELTEAEVKQFQETHYRMEGFGAIISAIQGNNPTDDILIKYGKASAELKDLGLNLVAAEIEELANDPTKQFTWTCDFGNKLLDVKLV